MMKRVLKSMEYECKKTVVWVFLQEIILNALERFCKIILKVAVGKTVWKVKEIFFQKHRLLHSDCFQNVLKFSLHFIETINGNERCCSLVTQNSYSRIHTKRKGVGPASKDWHINNHSHVLNYNKMLKLCVYHFL